MNSINIIRPYKQDDLWCFDDSHVGLHAEPFVGTMNEMIDRLTADIANAEEGVQVIFSSVPFPGYEYRLDWIREDGSGNIYRHTGLDTEGWLCPALFKYFEHVNGHLKMALRHFRCRVIAAPASDVEAFGIPRARTSGALRPLAGLRVPLSVHYSIRASCRR